MLKVRTEFFEHEKTLKFPLVLINREDSSCGYLPFSRRPQPFIHGAGPQLGELAAFPRLLGVRDPLSEVVALAQRWDLKGRGGAGFPFALKLQAVAESSSRLIRPAVVINATESEPLSFKDRFLLTYYLDLVLEGAVLCARALRGTCVYLVTHDDTERSSGLMESVKRFSKVVGVKIEVVLTPPALVSGQETSVVAAVNGESKPVPRMQPPRVSVSGVRGRPTLLSNAETYARLSQANRIERRDGTGDKSASLPYLGTVHLKTGESYIVEVDSSQSVSDIFDVLRAPLNESSIYLVGGYFGRWFRGDDQRMRTPISVPKKDQGIGFGGGLLVEVDRQSCLGGEVAFVSRWLSQQSALQCGPCKHGLPQVADEFERLVVGKSGDMEKVLRWTSQIRGRGGCSLPDSVCDLMESFSETVPEEIRAHQSGTCQLPYLHQFEGLHGSFHGGPNLNGT